MNFSIKFFKVVFSALIFSLSSTTVNAQDVVAGDASITAIKSPAQLQKEAEEAANRAKADKQWVQVDEEFNDISVDDRYVWGVTSNQVIKRRPIDGSGSWQTVSGTVRSLSATGNGWIWALQDGGRAWKCRKHCSHRSGWQKADWPLTFDPLVQVSGGTDYVWGRTGQGRVYRRPIDGSGNWLEATGRIQYLSGSGAGWLWAINPTGIALKCEKPCNGSVNKRWVHTEGSPVEGDPLTAISGGKDHVFSISRSGKIFYRPIDGTGSWKQVDGGLKNALMSPNGYVWGVNHSGKVYFIRMPGIAKMEESAAAKVEDIRREKEAAALAQAEAIRREKEAAALAQAEASARKAAAEWARNSYDHTLNTKTCEWGRAGQTWLYNSNSEIRLVTAKNNNELISYPVPPQRGITGRYHYWGPRGAPGKDGFAGADGYNWFADFNKSGEPQLASAHGNKIYVRGDQLIGSGSVYSVNGSWGAPGYTWAADFSGDGSADIASAIGGNVTMRIRTNSNNAEDGFRSEVWQVAGKWGNAAYTFVGDFNNDRKADIASAHGSTIYMSISTGTGFKNEVWPAPVAWGAPGYAWVGDFDGDGHKDDIASANGGSVSIAYSNGKSFDVKNRKIPNSWGAAGYTWASDFDRDGKTDIASAQNCKVSFMRSNGQDFELSHWDLALPVLPKCQSTFADLGKTTEYESGGGLRGVPDYDTSWDPNRGCRK